MKKFAVFAAAATMFGAVNTASAATATLTSLPVLGSLLSGLNLSSLPLLSSTSSLGLTTVLVDLPLSSVGSTVLPTTLTLVDGVLPKVAPLLSDLPLTVVGSTVLPTTLTLVDGVLPKVAPLLSDLPLTIVGNTLLPTVLSVAGSSL